MITKESKKTSMNSAWLAVAVLAAVFVASAFAQEEPVVEELQIPGTIEGTGTYFEVTDSNYLNITLSSSEPVNLRLESVPQMVVIHIEAAEGASSTQITLTGFEPSTTYYKYEDDYHNGVAFTTDGYGSYSFTQDLSISHLVFIQPQAGTRFIPSDTEIGTWDPVNRIYTLTTDVYETIQIDEDDLTLDGAGHNVTDGWDNGIYLSGRSGVTIKNLTVQKFSYGIYLYGGSGNTLTDNNTSNNYYGIYLMAYSENNTLTSNTTSNNNFGIYIFFSSNNTLTGNNASNNHYGIFLQWNSNTNTLNGNIASNNRYYGIYIRNSADNNILSGNTTSNNDFGIYVGSSNNTLTSNTDSWSSFHGIWLDGSNNILIGNTISNSNLDGFAIGGSNNILTGNTTNSNNGYGIFLYFSSDNTLTGNTISNNSSGVELWAGNSNEIYNNNFISNSTQARVLYSSGNLFNLDWPIGGNYWNDWTSPDDEPPYGFVDYPYVIDELNAVRDELPWTKQDGWANQAPEIETISGPVEPVQVDAIVEVSATFSDPDVGDTHTAIWDWGDDSTSDGSVDEGAQTVSGNHTYLAAGVYTVTLTVTDEADESDTDVFEFVVVYDPSEGFVTGGGWIDSPEGAYKADISMTGKANFGFVTKYKKGATVPTGQTEFVFKAGDLNFHSSSYEWLVVNQVGTNSQFKGSGTINGEGNYKFMLWAGDGEPDTFRIRIWTEGEGSVETDVYNNGSDQAIGGGSIVIHTN